MIQLRAAAIVGMVVLTVFSFGCHSTRPSADPSSDPSSEDRPSAEEGGTMESLFWARRDSARTRYTEADVQFMTGMIVHHAQALVMSRLAPTHGAGPKVLTLTARIINAQQDEIATMQNWLRERGLPVPEVEIDGLKLTVHGVDEHMMHMPGMLSEEQLRELDAARGPEFDRLFLKYMIQHHRGAVMMVDKLFKTDGAGQDEAAFKLASDINVDQKTEIARMERMLAQITGNDQDS